MSSSKKSHQRERHIRIRAVRRDPPDLRKLARAIIELAMAQAEADAARQAERPTPVSSPSKDDAA